MNIQRDRNREIYRVKREKERERDRNRQRKRYMQRECFYNSRCIHLIAQVFLREYKGPYISNIAKSHFDPIKTDKTPVFVHFLKINESSIRIDQILGIQSIDPYITNTTNFQLDPNQMNGVIDFGAILIITNNSRTLNPIVQHFGSQYIGPYIPNPTNFQNDLSKTDETPLFHIHPDSEDGKQLKVFQRKKVINK